MLERRQKYGLTDILVLLDDEAAMRSAQERNYDRLTVISHTELPLQNFRVTRKETGLIDLGRDEEMLARFRKTTRNEIARTYRDAALSCRTNAHVTDEGYALYRSFERTLGRVPFTREFFSNCAEVLILDEKVPISGIFLYPHIPTARIRSIFSKHDVQDRQRLGWAGRRAVFEACRYARSLGAVNLDLASVNSSAPEKAGIRNFKLSFAPRIVPEYIYIDSKPVYRFLELALGVIRQLRPW